MIGRAIICSAVVLLISGVALWSIWCWELVLSALEYIWNKGDWVKSLIVILVALAFLVCCWSKVLKRRKNSRTCPQECALPASPYPDPRWKRITGFWFKTDLCLARLKERLPHISPEQQYTVAKDYIVCVELDGKTMHIIRVPRGLLTDLTSAPAPVRPVVGRVGPHLEAAIVHDYLYVAWQMKGLPPTDDMRLFADKVMLAGMLETDMHCKAHAIYWAMRLFGTCSFYGRKPYSPKLPKEDMPNCCCSEQQTKPQGQESSEVFAS